jgi:hypothetical protein
MLLPPGYMAYFSGPQLTAVVDERDEVVWDASLEAASIFEAGASDPAGSGSSAGSTPPSRPLLPPLGE